MLREIASLLTTAKSAAAATLIAGSTVTGGAVVTVPEVREAVVERAGAVTTTLGSAVAAVAKAAKERRAADSSCGKPEVVAQRNEADKPLRDAFHADHRTLTELRGGKDTDHQKLNAKLNAAVKKAQDELRSVLTVALVDVARETQGRTGQVAKADLAAAAATNASPTIVFTETQQTTSTGDTVACEPTRGNEDVTLNATLQAIVAKAVLDMDDIVEKAATAGAPLAERGKPSEDARATDKKNEKGNKPGTPPGRTR